MGRRIVRSFVASFSSVLRGSRPGSRRGGRAAPPSSSAGRRSTPRPSAAPPGRSCRSAPARPSRTDQARSPPAPERAEPPPAGSSCSGRASSLTEAGPRLNRSTISLRLGSASAWNTRSSVAPWLSIRFSVSARRSIVKCRLNYWVGAAASQPGGGKLVCTTRRMRRSRNSITCPMTGISSGIWLSRAVASTLLWTSSAPSSPQAQLLDHGVPIGKHLGDIGDQLPDPRVTPVRRHAERGAGKAHVPLAVWIVEAHGGFGIQSLEDRVRLAAEVGTPIAHD